MGFDLSTAAPVATGGFDLSTAKPISSGDGIPTKRRSFSDVPGEALANVGTSAANFYKGLITAITNPVQTATGILDVGAGALQNMLPKELVNLVDQIDTNPEASKRAVQMANSVGGMFKDRYGSVEALKNTLATDPVGAAADLSTLFTGGASATARIAPTASKVMGTAAKYTNPLAPVTAAANYGLALGAKGTGNVIDAMRGESAANRAGSIVRNALTEEGRAPQNLAAAQNALANARPDMTVRQALADVTSPQVQYLGETVQAKTAPGNALAVAQAQEANRMAQLQGITPDLQAAETARRNLSAAL
jgi:hypothetical protein